MPAIDDLLADLASHPPTAPTPVAEIQGRARRRVRRRRALTGLAAVLVVVAVGVGGGAALTGDDPGQEVATGGGVEPTTLPPASSSGSLTPADATVTLDPATGHDDGTVVEIAFTEPTAGPISVAQCAREVEGAGGGSAVIGWCVDIVTGTAEDPPPYTLSRLIHTSNGTIDCAEEPARCILGVRVGSQTSSTDDRFAPLVFRHDLAPAPMAEVVVDGDEGTVGDGDTLLVTLTGVETGEAVSIMQCWVQDPAAGEDGRRCSPARGRSAVVQEGPETQLAFTAFHDVLVNRSTTGAYAPEWTPCSPCELLVTAGGRPLPLGTFPMDMEPTATPIRPTVAIEPSGPLEPGSAVTVRATGLQPGSHVPVGWCPASRAQGGGDPPCDLPTDPDGDGIPVGDDGTFEVGAFPVPAAGAMVHGADCAVPGTCGIGLDAGDAFSIMAFAPLDLTG
jgi:hypothetical protein